MIKFVSLTINLLFTCLSSFIYLFFLQLANNKSNIEWSMNESYLLFLW